MTFLSALYSLVISPLELLFEIIFTIADKIIGNVGFSLIFLSLAVNFLVLPLYKRADELQAEDRAIQVEMAPALKHIKKKFKGDERFFMIQEYYRINNYKPIYALKSSVSLLLQIPFFMAAYNLLSGMQSLKGMPFGIIADLGKEDAMFMIGNFPINMLPVLMTIINIVSGIIYTKGHPLRERIQVYGLAAFFLILLYHSPSGLVFYWLLNNVFSLVKNIVLKLKNPRKAVDISFAVAGMIILITSAVRADFVLRQKVLLGLGGMLLCIPFVCGLLEKKNKLKIKAPKKNTPAFIAGTVLMALITGLLIPSTIINDSVMEFMEAVYLINPALYVINAMCLSFGSWVLWGGVFYFSMNEKTKGLFCSGIWIICGVSILDYMLFGRKLGNISSTLQFDAVPSFTAKEYVINTVAMVAVAIVLGLIYRKYSKISKYVLLVASLSVFSIGVMDLMGIMGSYAGYKDYFLELDDRPNISLSKDGQNVVVLMMDRAMGTQVPYILNEKPELLEQFDGFTYYPNTMSYGSHTIFGAPALFGGYEYTPEKINERSSDSLISKHNEALKVMPAIFSENGYEVTVCNPPFAGYDWIPDLSIYDEFPDVYSFNTDGRFGFLNEDIYGKEAVEMSEYIHKIRFRDFYCFSLMKVAPVFLQETIYDGGYYNQAVSEDGNGKLHISSVVQKIDGLTCSTGYKLKFIEAYSFLVNLPDITIIEEGSKNTFLMMANDTTHSECLLQEPNYVPSRSVDNSAYDVDMVSRYTIDGVTMQMEDEVQITHYHVNMAAFMQLGKWFNYLKEQGVYDNTRIIIVSDHGKDLRQFDMDCSGQDMEYFAPLLMVKDFNATGFTVSEEFMTNGDTPVLATDGIIDNPENPFTGNPINSDAKNGPQTAFYSYYSDVTYNQGNVFHEGSWYRFNGGDMHDPDNWVYLGDH